MVIVIAMSSCETQRCVSHIYFFLKRCQEFDNFLTPGWNFYFKSVASFSWSVCDLPHRACMTLNKHVAVSNLLSMFMYDIRFDVEEDILLYQKLFSLVFEQQIVCFNSSLLLFFLFLHIVLLPPFSLSNQEVQWILSSMSTNIRVRRGCNA